MRAGEGGHERAGGYERRARVRVGRMREGGWAREGGCGHGMEGEGTRERRCEREGVSATGGWGCESEDGGCERECEGG